VCVTTNQPDTKSDPNPNPVPNPTAKQHAIVNIQLNVITRPYAFKKIHTTQRCYTVFQLSVVIVTLPVITKLT